MRYRSSNARGWTHHLGDLVAHVESSHGVQLSGGSTGAVVEAVGDDANVLLLVRGKGTGFTQLGNSSAVARVGTSTTGISAIQRYVVQFTPPDLSSFAATDSTFTVTGATTNANYVFTESSAVSTVYILSNVRCSTANEVTIRFTNHGPSTISGSSNRGTLLQFSY